MDFNAHNKALKVKKKEIVVPNSIEVFFVVVVF